MSNVVTMPANYRDPAPNPDYMGWGEKKLQVAQNLLLEAVSQEELPLVVASEAVGASAMLPSIEAAIRKFFKFDGLGWDFMVAERLLYGLTLEQTLMILQNIGNCVGASHTALLGSRIAHEVFALGQTEEPLGKLLLSIPFIPYSYGAGRWAGNMLGPGDGSYCGAQIKGSMEHGFLPCSTPGLEKYAGSGASDLPQGTASAGRLFGRSKAEIQKWTEKATPFDLLEAPKVKNSDDLWEIMVEKHCPVQICSGVMPTFWKNDSKYGPLYRMSQRASHSTQIVAAFEHAGQRFFVDRNQWGYGAHYGNPFFGIAKGCMVCPMEEFDKWARQGFEALAIGEIQGLQTNPGA